MLEIFRPLVILIGLVVFEGVPDILHSEYGLAERPAKIATGIAVFILVCVLDIVFRRWTSFKFVRRARHPGPANLEGVWLQRVAVGGRPYSISRIRYVSEGRWSYSGIGFDAHFTPKAEWHCASLHYDEKEKRWYFAGDAWLLNQDPGTGAYTRTDRGYVRPMLENLSENLHASSLDGTVVDVDLAGQSAVFKIALHRADDLYPVHLPSVEHIRGMPPREVEDVFARKNLKIHSRPAPEPVVPDANAGAPGRR